MDKRYQVFISSTYVDLVEERQAVIKAILELDQMPAGMELFPAVDDTAWNLIKSVIDASDYYVLIIGGRYGSMHETGLSYTEMEYDYAVSQKKRVIALLHGSPDSIPRAKTETDHKQWGRLVSFRNKVAERHMCQFWSSAQELKANLIISLTSTMKRHPATGWVRADGVPTGATIEEVLALRNQVSALERQLEISRTSPAEGTEHLQQADDEFLVVSKVNSAAHVSEEFETSISWDEIFGAVGPALLNESTDHELRTAIYKSFVRLVTFEARQVDVFSEGPLNVYPERDEIDTCIIQFRALGLIQESQRKRSVTDTKKYWSLTPYGDSKLVQLRALRRDPDSD